LGHLFRGSDVALRPGARDPLGDGDEQRPFVLRRALDDGAEHGGGVCRLPRAAQRPGEDPKVFGLADDVLQLTVHRDCALGFLDGELGLTSRDPDLRPPRQRLGLELVVAQSHGLAHRRVGGSTPGPTVPLAVADGRCVAIRPRRGRSGPVYAPIARE
jgi:hypothetical protein